MKSTMVHISIRPVQVALQLWLLLILCVFNLNAQVSVSPLADSDADGIPDVRDACNNTPRGAVLLAKGCSALDIVENPQVLISDVRTLANEPASRLRSDTDAAFTVKELDDSQQFFIDAVRLM